MFAMLVFFIMWSGCRILPSLTIPCYLYGVSAGRMYLAKHRVSALVKKELKGLERLAERRDQ
jgi:hypothetical protein